MTRLGEPGLEGQLPAVQLRTGDLSPGDSGQGPHRGEVLGPQPGPGTAGPDLLEAKRRPQHGRQGEGGAENLAAPSP